jgi:hypothetical protein
VALHNGKRMDKDFFVLWNLLKIFDIDKYHMNDWFILKYLIFAKLFKSVYMHESITIEKMALAFLRNIHAIKQYGFITILLMMCF